MSKNPAELNMNEGQGFVGLCAGGEVGAGGDLLRALSPGEDGASVRILAASTRGRSAAVKSRRRRPTEERRSYGQADGGAHRSSRGRSRPQVFSARCVAELDLGESFVVSLFCDESEQMMRLRGKMGLHAGGECLSFVETAPDEGQHRYIELPKVAHGMNIF